VSSANQRLQIIRCPIIRIYSIQILRPVAMVPASAVRNNGRDPDSVESSTLDIVQFGLEPLEGTAAVVSEVRAGGTTSVGVAASDTVGKYEVDGAGLPSRGVSGVDDGGEGEEEGGEG
jgi:hypothetical protein